MIIDTLTHIHPDSFGKNANLRTEFLIEKLDNSPVDKAIVTAIAGNNHYSTSPEYGIEHIVNPPNSHTDARTHNHP